MLMGVGSAQTRWVALEGGACTIVDVRFRRHARTEIGFDQLSVFGAEHVRHDEHVQGARGLAQEPEPGYCERECAASARRRRRHLGEPPHANIETRAFESRTDTMSIFLSPSGQRVFTVLILDTKSQVRVPRGPQMELEVGLHLARREIMPKFVIERELPGAGKLSMAELKGIAQKSCDVLRGMGPKIQWQQSYVTDDKIYCVYLADNENDVLEHAQRGNFPANKVARVRAVIDPGTAEEVTQRR
jgi:hypothetical protein